MDKNDKHHNKKNEAKKIAHDHETQKNKNTGSESAVTPAATPEHKGKVKKTYN